MAEVQRQFSVAREPLVWEMPTHLGSAAARRGRSATKSGSIAGDVAYLFVLSVPVAATVIHTDFGEVGGLNISGWLWAAYFCMAAFLLTALLVQGGKIRFPLFLWAAWLTWLWVSIVWTEAELTRAVQDAMQISSPVLMAMLASCCITSQQQLQRLIQLTAAMAVLLGMILLAKRFGVLPVEDSPAPFRVMAITMSLLGAVILAGFPRRTFLPWLGWGACAVLALLSGSRMATLALMALPIAHPALRGLQWRILAGIAAAGLAVIAFHTPYFQERFFITGSGTLGDVFRGEFLSFGRFESWPMIWERAWDSPIVGAGVGSTFQFVPTVWDEMHHVHNDYLRVGFELGIVGLTIWVAVLLWQMLHLRNAFLRSAGYVQIGFAAAILGLVGFMIIAATDNILVYNLVYTNPWMLIMGAAYGVYYSQSGSAEDHTPQDAVAPSEPSELASRQSAESAYPSEPTR